MGEITENPSRPDWHAAWAAARERLRRELGDAVFDAWIAPLTLEAWGNGEVVIGTTKSFVRNWVTERYSSRIERALHAEVGFPPASIAVAITKPQAVDSRPRHVVRERAPAVAAGQPQKGLLQEDGSAADAGMSLWARMLHPQQTFDSFVPGTANEFGHGAMRAFAEGQNNDFPHLFIHGGFGFGKTHLLNAAALEFRKRGRRTLFLRAEDFMRHFCWCPATVELRWRQATKMQATAEVLIVDDLQHICRSTATASEFLYTVNAFADLRRRVIIAADRAPAALEGLGADIKSRLAGGLVIALGKPDRATRLAILQRRAADFTRLRADVVIPDAVLERIADMDDASPREMIGLFTKLATYADLTKKPVTMEMADEAVGLRLAPAGKTSIEDIQRKTAEFLQTRRARLPFAATRTAGGPTEAGSNVSLAKTDDALPARDRTALWRTGSYDGSARLPPKVTEALLP